MADVMFQAYDDAGQPLLELKTPGYLTDVRHEPFRPAPRIEGGSLRCSAPPGKPFFLNLSWEAPGFGRVCVRADNGGEGYRCLPETELQFNLNYQLARSRWLAVSGTLSEARREGVELPEEGKAHEGKTRDLLARADKAGDEGERARLSQQALAAGMWLGEIVALARARHAIARRGPRPDFLFGANAFGYAQPDDDYALRYRELFNFGTVPFYWGGFEPEEGKPNYERADEITKWLTGSGMTAKGHPLVWFYPETTPDWQRRKTYEEMRRLCVERVRTIVARYAGRINIWDIINEAHDWANVFHYSHEQMIQIVGAISRAAKEANSRAVRIVNNCILWGDYVATGNTMQGQEDRELWSPLRFLRALDAAEVDYDVVGLQIYYPSRDLFEISQMLDRYATLGKPMHITELGTPSSCDPDDHSHWSGKDVVEIMGWWHAPWSETIQADWIEQFYTIAYSKPLVEAVTWWDFADCRPWHFFPHGGFLRHDMTPKESRGRLQRLIASWRDQ